MRQIIHGSTHTLADARQFVEGFGVSTTPDPELRALFPLGRDVLVARAAGRATLFGAVPDELGVDRLLWPTAQGVLVALQRDRNRQLHVVGRPSEPGRLSRSFELPFHYLTVEERPLAYDVARAYFARYDDWVWAAPVAGVFLALMRERALRFQEGARVLVGPAPPAGLAGPEAAALALARAVCAEANVAADARVLSRIVDIAGRQVAGWRTAPSSLAALARLESGRVLLASSAARDAFAAATLPDALALWILAIPSDSVDTAARTARLAVAVRLAERVARMHGLLPPELSAPQPVPRSALVADLLPAKFETAVLPLLPETMNGREAASLVGDVVATGWDLDPEATYPMRAAARFVVGEHARAQRFVASLLASPPAQDPVQLGALLAHAHRDGIAAGVVPRIAERLVELATEHAAGHVLGARAFLCDDVCVLAVLANAEAGLPRLDALTAAILAETGRRPFVSAGSSPGATRFGYLRLRGA